MEFKNPNPLSLAERSDLQKTVLLESNSTGITPYNTSRGIFQRIEALYKYLLLEGCKLKTITVTGAYLPISQGASKICGLHFPHLLSYIESKLFHQEELCQVDARS